MIDIITSKDKCLVKNSLFFEEIVRLMPNIRDSECYSYVKIENVMFKNNFYLTFVKPIRFFQIKQIFKCDNEMNICVELNIVNIS